MLPAVLEEHALSLLEIQEDVKVEEGSLLYDIANLRKKRCVC